MDNASSDGSVEYVRNNYDWVRVAAADRNYGFAKANNIGAESAAGDYVMFLNNDTVVTPDWLDPLVDALRDKDVGAVGSKILLMDKPDTVNSAGASIIITGSGFDIGFKDKDSQKYNVRGFRGGLCAAAMMVRKQEFLDIGGFDEDYFMYSEDTDLCWRYWLFGKKVEYVPGSVIYHKYGGTSGTERDVPIRVFYGTRNALFNIVKNYQPHNLLVALLVSLTYHLVRMLGFLLELKFRSALLMIKAYVSFFKGLPKLIKKRREIQARRKVKDRYLFSNSVIAPFSSVIKEFVRLLKVEKPGSCSPDE
ncbi:rhamnosyltransferase WbbL [bacterium BMS3Abin10]|nr:rhamnosyltransferase WbbL [bacterium BMS3Abin10]GBE39172.1 rhamnosyltransferase WbbL [bacterium BMS3Bbin08]